MQFLNVNLSISKSTILEGGQSIMTPKYASGYRETLLQHSNDQMNHQ